MSDYNICITRNQLPLLVTFAKKTLIYYTSSGPLHPDSRRHWSYAYLLADIGITFFGGPGDAQPIKEYQ